MTLIQKWGNHSYSVCLIHSIIAFEGSKVITHLWNRAYANISQGVAFILWLPIVYVIIYYAGILFTRYLSLWNIILKKGEKHEYRIKLS